MNNNSWASKNSMRGLSNFIQDIRRSRGKEAEQKRVNKELANIRKNFAENSNLNGYKKKKYVCKLLYIYTLGYEVDFGFMEAINLLKSTKYTEKQTGYLAIGILLHEDHSMIPLLVQALADDLGARSEYAQCLALSTIANIGGKQMAEAQLAPAATKLLLAKTSPNNVKKKAALCLLQLHRKYSDFISADQWADRIVQLMQLKDLGVVSSLMSLLLAVAQKEPEGYEGCVDTVIELLGKIVLDKDYPREYLYYNVPNPWLQVKMLRFLRQYPPTPNQKTLRRLHDVLKRILSYGEKGNIKTQPSANHRNAINCVMFEAIDLIIHYDSDASLIRTAAELVARFLGVKDTNVKYLVLEAMAHLSAMADKQTSSLIRSHHETVIRCLRDADISIRRRALDLLYAMCDRSNSKRIVAELLAYLADAEFDIREELVLKIAILAEKFASNYAWYVDTILTLISTAPDDVPDDIWFRVVQIVTNHDDIQEYACVTALKALRQSSSHQTTVKVAGYLLGEFGHLIDNKPGSGPAEQFEALHSKFHSSSAATKAVLLSGYAKMLNLYPDELGPKIMDVFRQLSTTVDAEIQQRACEYYNLARLGNPDLMQSVLDVMPAFQLHEGEEELEEEGASHEEVHHHHQQQQEYDSGSDDEKYDAEKESPRSPQQQPHSFAAVDDSLQHFTAPSAPAPSSVTNPTYGGIGGEIFGVTSSPVRSPAAPVENVDTVPDVVPVKSKPTEQGLMQLFRLLCVRSDGLLYEDATIQIGIKSEYSKGVGRVMLYYGNTSNSTITQFNVVIAPVNYLSIQVQENPPTIGPLRQESQLLNVACISEFQDALSMQVAFLANGKSEILSLRLPIVLTKFVEPLIFSGQDFFAEWKKYSGPPCEHQSIFKASQAIDLSAITNILSNGFRFAVLPEVDPNKNNLVAAGTLYTSNKLTPVLLRLETNPEANMIRLTIRSSSGQVTASIKTLVSAQLMS